jgi:hypothetical protein
MLFDAFNGHLTLEIEATIISIYMVLVIHRGMTSQLQILDVVMNKTFRNHLNQFYGDWLLGRCCAFTESVSQV